MQTKGHARGRSSPTSPSFGHPSSKPAQTTQLQGRAFAAPRQQSLDRMRAQQADIEHLGDILNNSPRKYAGRSSKDTDRTTQTAAPREHTSRDKSHTRQPPPRPDYGRTARAVHQAPSAASLGGISVGSYALFSSSNVSLDMKYHTPPAGKSRVLDGAAYAGGRTNMASVRRKLRNVASLDSLSLSSRRSNRSGASGTTQFLRCGQSAEGDGEKGGEKPNKPISRKGKGRETVREGPARGRWSRYDEHEAQKREPRRDVHKLDSHNTKPASYGLQMHPAALGLTSHGRRVLEEGFSSSSGQDDRAVQSLEAPAPAGVVRRASLKFREQIDRSKPIIRRKGSAAGGLRDWWEGKRGKSRERERSVDKSRGNPWDRDGWI